MSQDRRLERTQLIFYLRVFGRKTNRLIGNLADISTEGIRLVCDRPVKTKVIFRLRMDLPRKIKGKREVTFNAKSAWCREDSNTDFYNTGFQFTQISPNDVIRIEHLIEEYSNAA